MRHKRIRLKQNLITRIKLEISYQNSKMSVDEVCNEVKNYTRKTVDELRQILKNLYGNRKKIS